MRAIRTTASRIPVRTRGRASRRLALTVAFARQGTRECLAKTVGRIIGVYNVYLLCLEPDFCLSNPCLNGGLCEKLVNGFSLVSGYTCKCSAPYLGDHCEKGTSGKNFGDSRFFQLCNCSK